MPVNSSLINNKAASLRSNIKAAVAQLDQWDALQDKQRASRQAAKARFRNFADRLAVAKYRAKQSFPSLPSDPLCEHCESPFHLANDCDIADTLEALEREDQLESTSTSQVSTHEDPSTGIHRSIVHRLYLNVCELYTVHHPRFYTGPTIPQTQPQVIYPVPLAGPDYLALAIVQAATDLQGIVDSSDIRKHSISCSPICRLYYSKAFPISFSEFCHKIAKHLDEIDTDSY